MVAGRLQAQKYTDAGFCNVPMLNRSRSSLSFPSFISPGSRDWKLRRTPPIPGNRVQADEAVRKFYGEQDGGKELRVL